MKHSAMHMPGQIVQITMCPTGLKADLDRALAKTKAATTVM